jgi:hypothetical protein
MMGNEKGGEIGGSRILKAFRYQRKLRQLGDEDLSEWKKETGNSRKVEYWLLGILQIK